MLHPRPASPSPRRHPQLLLDLRPNEEHAKDWILKPQTSVAVQAAPDMSEHEASLAAAVAGRRRPAPTRRRRVRLQCACSPCLLHTLPCRQVNTTAVVSVTRGMVHTEGGWPKEVDHTEAEQVRRRPRPRAGGRDRRCAGVAFQPARPSRVQLLPLSPEHGGAPSSPPPLLPHMQLPPPGHPLPAQGGEGRGLHPDGAAPGGPGGGAGQGEQRHRHLRGVLCGWVLGAWGCDGCCWLGRPRCGALGMLGSSRACTSAAAQHVEGCSRRVLGCPGSQLKWLPFPAPPPLLPRRPAAAAPV